MATVWRAEARDYFAIGAVLVWAALGKVANSQEFYTALLAYRLPLPALALQATAAILPWLELSGRAVVLMVFAGGLSCSKARMTRRLNKEQARMNTLPLHSRRDFL